MGVSLAENQVCFTCHLKRGGLDVKEIVSYELVQFVGYFSKLKSFNIRYFIDEFILKFTGSDVDVENILLQNANSIDFSSDNDSK